MRLFADPSPPTHELVDLRCCDVADLLAEMRETLGDTHAGPDLVHSDSPWPYARELGSANPSNIFATLSYGQIRAHHEAAREISPACARLALWYTWPLVAEIDGAGIPGDRWVFKSGGAWSKVDHHGVGHHWAGNSEPVRIYTAGGAAWRDTSVPLQNTWISKPGPHSAKPVGWLTMMVRRWVPPGGMVLDLYAGLGSMAEAVLLAGEGRRYVGAEIDPDRHRAALGRLAQVRAP